MSFNSGRNGHGFGGKADRRAGLADRGHAGADRQLAGDEVGAARRAARLGIVVGEQHALAGDPVEIGRAARHHSAVVGADVPDADVVAHDDDDVGLLGRGLRVHRRGAPTVSPNRAIAAYARRFKFIERLLGMRRAFARRCCGSLGDEESPADGLHTYAFGACCARWLLVDCGRQAFRRAFGRAEMHRTRITRPRSTTLAADCYVAHDTAQQTAGARSCACNGCRGKAAPDAQSARPASCGKAPSWCAASLREFPGAAAPAPASRAASPPASRPWAPRARRTA